MSKKILLTKDWLTEIQDELKILKDEKRFEIAEKLKEAISYWDLSENSEYEDARNEQAQVELRILELEGAFWIPIIWLVMNWKLYCSPVKCILPHVLLELWWAIKKLWIEASNLTSVRTKL